MDSVFRTINRAACFALAALCVWASMVWSDAGPDVLILGEQHDNPAHHARQAQAIRDGAPKAVIYEMLTPEEAAQLAGVDRSVEAMTAATEGFHWSNIADYADVLAHSPVIVGAALPREQVRAAFGDGAAAVFGAGADVYGLIDALPEEELATRKQAQFDAHCEAMPLAMMGGMVEAQRLRDAAFARATLEALETYGAPVVVITGNGHARMDWGCPSI